LLAIGHTTKCLSFGTRVLLVGSREKSFAIHSLTFSTGLRAKRVRLERAGFTTFQRSSAPLQTRAGTVNEGLVRTSLAWLEVSESRAITTTFYCAPDIEDATDEYLFGGGSASRDVGHGRAGMRDPASRRYRIYVPAKPLHMSRGTLPTDAAACDAAHAHALTKEGNYILACVHGRHVPRGMLTGHPPAILPNSDLRSLPFCMVSNGSPAATSKLWLAGGEGKD